MMGRHGAVGARRGAAVAAGLALVVAGCTAGMGDDDGGGVPDSFIPVEGGVFCRADRECDDRVACTVDHCDRASCTHVPCEDCCDDGLTCVPGFGCRAAPDACTTDAECRDDVRCTLDSCQDATSCVHEPQPALCDEGEICLPAVGCIPEPPTSCETTADCEASSACVGEWSCLPEFGCQFVALRDCDDGDACTIDACVESEGGCVNTVVDGDGDGYGPSGCGDDCDDADASVSPGAAEACDGADDDCDGRIDEGFECVLGASESCTSGCSTTGIRTCGSACTWEGCASPAETCNAMDDDCDESIDEAFACVRGSSSACNTTCGSTGTRECLADCSLDACVPPLEVCNGVDDNCNGACDEGFGCCQGATLDCTALGYFRGTATCPSGCGDWNVSGCSNCGNGTIQTGEQCDDVNLGGATCSSVDPGFGGGTLVCGSSCQFDTSGCSRCGNGEVDPGEDCDGGDLDHNDCTTIPGGYDEGTLACDDDCTFDTSMCGGWEADGFYTTSPRVTYTCGPFGLVNIDFSALQFQDDGATLTVPFTFCGSSTPYMTGPSLEDGTRDIAVCCTYAGTCNETYCVSGSFDTDESWSGTFTASYSGSCGGGGFGSPCTAQSFPITGSR